MSELNAEKAREIVSFCNENHTHDYKDGLCGFGECRVAFGYLAALEGPEVKMLIHALENHRTDHRICPCLKALSAFRKAVGK